MYINVVFNILGLNPVFTKRGAITIRSLKAGMADYEDEGGLDEEDISLLKVNKHTFICLSMV